MFLSRPVSLWVLFLSRHLWAPWDLPGIPFVSARASLCELWKMLCTASYIRHWNWKNQCWSITNADRCLSWQKIATKVITSVSTAVCERSFGPDMYCRLSSFFYPWYEPHFVSAGAVHHTLESFLTTSCKICPIYGVCSISPALFVSSAQCVWGCRSDSLLCESCLILT